MMEGLKDALAYAVELAAPEIHDIGNEAYCTQKLYRVDEKEDATVDALAVSTLTGFVDFIIHNRDDIDLAKTMVSIDGTRTVSMFSVPNKDKRRETFIRACAVTPEHHFGRWEDSETFVIGLMSKFANSDHQETLIKYIGNMQEDQGVQTMDDGISQKIVSKTGIARACLKTGISA